MCTIIPSWARRNSPYCSRTIKFINYFNFSIKTDWWANCRSISPRLLRNSSSCRWWNPNSIPKTTISITSFSTSNHKKMKNSIKITFNLTKCRTACAKSLCSTIPTTTSCASPSSLNILLNMPHPSKSNSPSTATTRS